MRLPTVKTLWFAASVSSSIWYIYWICYDVFLWNKPLAHVRQFNLAGLILSVAFIFVGIGLNKIYHFDKPISPFRPVHQKSDVVQTGKSVFAPAPVQQKSDVVQTRQVQQVKPVQQARESQQIQPAKEEQKQIRRDASILPNCGFYLGYLHKRPKSEDIPQECLICIEVVKCISPTNSA